MALNKIVYKNRTLMDLTNTTATEADVFTGKVFYRADGSATVGTNGGSLGLCLNHESGEYILPDSAYQLNAGPIGFIVNRYSSGGQDDDPSSLNLQDKIVTYSPTESEQSHNVTADSRYDGLNKVTINIGKIASNYVGSGVSRNNQTNLIVDGATITASAGYYQNSVSKTVASGTAGTPTATKGIVNNHSITITPSVTNTTGYITGSTKTGTDITVSASELVSGSKSITSNSTNIDVTNYATVDVNVPSEGGNDFIITLTKNASTGIWEPDCTFAEAQAAYSDGKNVAFKAFLDGLSLPCGEDSHTSNRIRYFVFELVTTSNGAMFNYIEYIWDSLGIDANNPYPYYETNSATATPADVASGKVFYNADGYQTGTASSSTSTLVTKTITANGTYNASSDSADGYSSVTVNVPILIPSLQTKSVTPSESSQTVTADSGYDGLSSVSVGAISSTYVGSDITRRSSTNLTVSGATVTAPAGYYAEAATKSVASGSASTPATTITANPTISVSSSGLITSSVSGSKSITPTISAGYVSSGTAGTISVSGSKTQQLTTKAATTIYPSTTDQTIPSGTYLTGTQTIKAVTVSGLSAGNIASGVTVKVGDSADDDRITSVTGTLSFVTYYTGSSDPSASTGSNGDIYLKVVT